ncbi:MAG: NAD(P)-dependent oxidoreductase [Erysipelotrichales bacterium]|nr:NAD(P)-dependent oxidoreductase [Erysipelotrichales bacterium]
MKNVIVTGASGFIGSNLVRNLVSRNINVCAIDFQFSEELQHMKNVQCILCKDKTMNDIKMQLESTYFDCFFHLAWGGTSGPNRANYELQLNNVKMTCDYIMMASELGCKRFIYASSINEMETYEYLQSDGIRPSGGYIYGTGKMAAHLMGETVAYMNKVEFIPVIITNIYGVGEKSARLVNSTIRKLLKNEYCSFTEGKQMYDFIYITDAINSVIEVADKGKPFNRYYIGSGYPKPLRDFLTELRDVVNPNAKLGIGDIPFNGIDISYDQFKLKKVYEDTGYENKIPFAEGIRLTVEYINSEEE